MRNTIALQYYKNELGIPTYVLYENIIINHCVTKLDLCAKKTMIICKTL